MVKRSCRLLAFFLLVILLFTLHADAQPTAPASTAPAEAHQELSLDRGWLFHLGDVPFPVIKGQDMSYGFAKAGNSPGAASATFDDSDWRTLDLPHDWAVEGPFDQNANLSQGFRPRGFSWYRRYFKLDPADQGRHLEIKFDGVSTNCTVWVNGILAARNFCGYTSFNIDITPFARFGDDENVISVRVDAEQQEGWWYEGAGIYRHTWLIKQSPVYIKQDGVFANPVKQADGSWTLPVEVTLGSNDKAEAKVHVESILRDAAGTEVARASADGSVKPFTSSAVTFPISTQNPKLWSLEEPTLYQVETIVTRDGNPIDHVTTTCGFRTIRFDSNQGFFLNDQHVKLQGVCNHQDMAGVGVAVPDSIWEFRLRKLKEMGANAYRCAHNAPAKEFLDACDRMGMLVMDENRNFNTTDEYRRQLEWMVRRDRNHPSIILWSVFNEEPMQDRQQGFDMVRQMTAEVHLLDPTRPTTAAQSGAMTNPVNASLAADVAGFNYQHWGYDRYHELHPDRPATSSEDTSAVETRGMYFTDKSKSILDSYDLQWQPWGRNHRDAWKEIDKRPFLAGGFVWTGFDYRGEPQPLGWPAVGSSFGILDLCGFPKTAFYIHQTQWIHDRPILYIAPHWNWAGSEGKPIKVMTITTGDKVDLTLNGKPVGSTAVDKYEMAYIDVPYEAGTLEAVASKDGKEIARYAVETTGAPAAVELIPDRTQIHGDGRDAMPITVRVLDAQGRTVPTANNEITFELTGPGTIIGLGNGDPLCHEPEKGNKHSIFNGLGQVIVQTTENGAGELKLHATADGLTAADLVIPVIPLAGPAQVPVALQSGISVQRWRSSSVFAERPDPNMTIDQNDQNTWTNTRPGNLNNYDKAGFVIFRGTVRQLRATVRKNGGRLVLHNLAGVAEVWIDGKLAGKRETAEKADFAVDFPAGDGDHIITVLIQTTANESAGLGGTVVVESLRK